MKILPRPFPVAYILEWHQHEISQKERVNPELKAAEVLPKPSPIAYILESNKACPWTRDTAAYKAYVSKKFENKRMFTSSLKGP